MFKSKFPTKPIFRIFPILRINGMAAFCNLFMERLVLTTEFIDCYDCMIGCMDKAIPKCRTFGAGYERLSD